MASLIAISAWAAAAPCSLCHTDLRINENSRHISLRESRLPWSTDIYAFWYCSQYACLTPAAHKYLSVLLTSVASEQLFSAAEQLDADRRSNLIGSNAEKLLFLVDNIRLFHFNYKA